MMKSAWTITDSPSAATCLTDLGHDILGGVAHHLPHDDLFRFAQVSRDLRSEFSKPRHWQPHISALALPPTAAAISDPRAAWLKTFAPKHQGPRLLRDFPVAEGGPHTLAHSGDVLVGRRDDGLVDAWPIDAWPTDARPTDAGPSDAGPSQPRLPLALRSARLLAAEGDIVAAVVGDAPTAHIWSLSGGTLHQGPTPHAAPVDHLLIHGDQVITGAEDGSIKIWSATQQRTVHSFANHAAPMSCIAASGDSLITGSYDGSTRVRQISTARLIGSRPMPRCIVAVGIEKTIAVSASRFEAIIWSVGSGTVLRKVEMTHMESIASAAISRGIVAIASSRYGSVGYVDLWSAPWQHPQSFTHHAYVLAIALDGDTLVCGLSNGTATVASISQRRIRHTLQAPDRGGEPSGVNFVALRGDSLAIGGADFAHVYRFDAPEPAYTPASALQRGLLSFYDATLRSLTRLG